MDVSTMQGLHGIVSLALLLALGASSAVAQTPFPGPDRLPVHQDQRTRSASLPYTPAAPAARTPVAQEVHVPGARFVKLHFEELEIPSGVMVEVSNPDRSEVYRYSSDHRDAFTFDASQGDDGLSSFWAMSISGDTAIVRMTGATYRYDPARHRVRIDRHLAPLHPGSQSADVKRNGLFTADPALETICGINERYDAVCWQNQYPNEYGRAAPVAMLVTSQGLECTAWRVGPNNRMMTAAHCVSNKTVLAGSELWFNFETETCGGTDKKQVVKVAGDDMLISDGALDYTLFTVKDFPSISSFGYLGLDVRNGAQGEGIFIPQHGHGKPRQIALESDMNVSGFCEIDDASTDGYAANSDIGYYCDTTTNSSGAPVVSSITGRAIALHHLGGCYNQGTKIARIWPEISGFFGNTVPEGDDDENWSLPNLLPEASFSVECEDMVCAFNGQASSDPDGTIVNHYWTFGDGGDALGTHIEHSYAEQGNYEVTLTVEDNEGATNQTSQLADVTLPNVEPQAKFSTVCVENKCSFDASKSLDEDGEIIAYDWALGDGSEATGSNVKHDYSEANDFTIVLTVKDDREATGKASQTISTTMPNVDPVADFTWSCNELDCSFDGRDSTDPDGEIVQYSWRFGDGKNGSGETATHRFGDGGGYDVRLTVEDAKGASHSITRRIEVIKPLAGPQAEFDVSCQQLSCSVDAEASVGGSHDISRYDWTFGDGSSASGAKVSHEYSDSGAFYIILKVTDKNGAQDTKTQLVRVKREGEISLDVTTPPAARASMAALNWRGATSGTVLVYRNGEMIAEVANRGKYLVHAQKTHSKTLRYKVCQSDGNLCSNEVSVRFKPR
ncbi:MAG: PKD domain-containing protein [Xanthomonadales bacterium]|jgi:PKD repeat protein|nr:PKD domain-containing protein [Xanthomonadales bacterium]